MVVNSIRCTTIPVNDIQQQRIELSSARSNLSQKITNIKNIVADINKSIAEHKKNISKNQSLVKSLRSVSDLHGDEAIVRLKNGYFKYANDGNFFKKILNGKRYQAEREAAANKINTNEKSVSAGVSIKILEEKIDSSLSKISELKITVGDNNHKITNLESKKYGVERKLDALIKIEANERKSDEKKRAVRENFSMIYQSDAGCKAINIESRNQFAKLSKPYSLSSNDVIGEYRRIHGYEIFNKGNKYLKSTIEQNCKHLPELVKLSAKTWYTPTDKNIITYRGQCSTEEGLSKLISQFQSDKEDKLETVYKVGQFFSSSKKLDIAEDFANRGQHGRKVIFKIIGNSSNGLCVKNGLSFDNDESERLYSPLANFKVTDVSKSSSGVYHIELKEVSDTNSQLILPY